MLHKPFDSFKEASQEVLEFLHKRFGFDLWMVTRTEGDDWIVLSAEDHGYGVGAGDVFRWTDSFCCKMVEGLGPCIAPKSDEIEVYRNAPIGSQVDIGAYVGVPLRDGDGNLFGTLCAIDPSPQPEEISSELPMMELIGRLLSSLLSSELKLMAKLPENILNIAELVNPELGVLTATGWSQALNRQHENSLAFQQTAFLVILDVQDSAQLVEAIGCVNQAVSNSDIVAAIDNRVLILVPNGTQESGEKLISALEESLESESVHATCTGQFNDRKTDLKPQVEKALQQN